MRAKTHALRRFPPGKRAGGRCKGGSAQKNPLSEAGGGHAAGFAKDSGYSEVATFAAACGYEILIGNAN
ncbi:MAG TPA: hypothetical protein PLB67_20175, partial [Candidatus Hydrogenedentes bacterium]|nr:hypothetical protein [Candidatus Hydrogenedentota bacterium]